MAPLAPLISSRILCPIGSPGWITLSGSRISIGGGDLLCRRAASAKQAYPVEISYVSERRGSTPEARSHPPSHVLCEGHYGRKDPRTIFDVVPGNDPYLGKVVKTSHRHWRRDAIGNNDGSMKWRTLSKER
jgi:hypothetical protein